MGKAKTPPKVEEIFVDRWNPKNWKKRKSHLRTHVTFNVATGKMTITEQRAKR